MPINRALFEALQPGVAALNNQKSEAQRQQQEMALRKYLQTQKDGSIDERGNYTPGTQSAAQRDQQNFSIDQTSELRDKYMKDHPGFHGTFRVGPNGVEISENQQVVRPNMMLTPAQEAAEKSAGKKISDFEGGGKQSGEANVGQIQGVQKELQDGKRDGYDKFVGGALENHPALMAFLAPSEKSRRDRVQNAMLGMLHDAGIPRPTQWDIQRVFGQVYDPASDDKTNIARLTQAASKIGAHQQAQQAQADQYHKTGYATIGSSPAPQAPAGAAPQTQAPQAPQTKNVGGTTYTKNPATGLWETQ